MIHRTVFPGLVDELVVNCFQFYNFMDDSQARYGFDLSEVVVNCFQFYNFMDDSQDGIVLEEPEDSCELLSVL